VLGDLGVDIAVLETARGGMLREGLAFQECDVGCVTNVGADHLGLRDIHSVEDLAEVKAIVVEAVKPDGWSVLNADNPHTAAMHEQAGGRICYFSVKPNQDWPMFLKQHVQEGGRAFACDTTSGSADLVLYDAGQTLFVARAAEIPATIDAMAVFNIENALAAAAMAYCHGTSLTTIRSALTTFGTSYEQSPGRLNVTQVGGIEIILDYAHNPDGLRALGDLVRRMRNKASRTIGVIGIAGDRRDEDVIEMGRVAAQIFDRLILKEDEDLRGRSRGETASLLGRGARAEGFPHDQIDLVLREKEAIDRALEQAQPGDRIVVAVDDIHAVWQHVSQLRPLDPGPFVSPSSFSPDMRAS
jgi:cyanophycin synthetase